MHEHRALGGATPLCGQPDPRPPTVAPVLGPLHESPVFAQSRCRPRSSSLGAFVPPDGLDTAIHTVLDQVIAWSGALRGVREAKAQTPTAA
jgi:hypothetical protein